MLTGIEKTWLLKVGTCRHPGKITGCGNSWKVKTFPAVVALIKHRHFGYILFDTGYSEDFHEVTTSFPEKLYSWLTPVSIPQEQALLTQLNRIGLSAVDIRYVFISHFHADHISGLKQFKQAKFICSHSEYQIIKNSSRFAGVKKGFMKNLLPSDFEQRCFFIENQEIITLNKTMEPFHLAYDLFCDSSCMAIGLPGHSQGQFGLRIDTPLVNINTGEISAKKPLFFIADACWTINAIDANSMPSKLAYIVMDSAINYKSSIQKLRHLRQNNPSLELIPSHCELTFARLNHA